MDKRPDIYESPRSPAGKEGGGRVVEPSHAEIRARTWRNSLVFLLAMLALLGLALWLVHIQEQRIRSREITGEETVVPEPPYARLLRMTNVAPDLAIPVGGPAEPVPAIEPERMAEAMAQLRLGNEYLFAREFDRAEYHAQQALQIWTNMNAALRLLGAAYTQRGQFDQGIAVLEKALRGDPFNAEIYNNMATAFMQKGAMLKAEELLQTALQIAPEYAATLLNLGLLYLARAQYEPAADYLERGLDRLPDEPAPRNNLAVAQIRLGRYDDARRNLEIVIRQRPRIANTYFNMAITYALEKNLEQAMVWIRRGGERCSPVLCQKFLSDSDFNSLRGLPEFQNFLNSLYPVLPAPPGR
jgi:tetratricopeptide (TPR) repeat protein